MTRAKMWVSATAVAMALMVPGTGHAKQVAYVLGASPTPYPICRPEVSIGGACFLPKTGAQTLNVVVRDDLNAGVAGRIVFTDGYASENPLTVPFCGSKKNVAIPSGTLGITVHLGLTRTAGLCGDTHATKGTISLRQR